MDGSGTERMRGIHSILLVEDHADTAQVLTRLLSQMGLDVIAVDRAAAALAAARLRKVDLLVADLMLPDLDGWELLRRLRAEGHQFPAIALSGCGAIEDLSRSREAGFREHLIKPLGVNDLPRAIASAGSGR